MDGLKIWFWLAARGLNPIWERFQTSRGQLSGTRVGRRWLKISRRLLPCSPRQPKHTLPSLPVRAHTQLHEEQNLERLQLRASCLAKTFSFHSQPPHWSIFIFKYIHLNVPSYLKYLLITLSSQYSLRHLAHLLLIPRSSKEISRRGLKFNQNGRTFPPHLDL